MLEKDMYPEEPLFNVINPSLLLKVSEDKTENRQYRNCTLGPLKFFVRRYKRALYLENEVLRTYKSLQTFVITLIKMIYSDIYLQFSNAK